MEQKFVMHLTVEEFKVIVSEVVKETLRSEMPRIQNGNALITVQEAASLLNLAVNTLYEKTSEKLIPHYKYGKKLLFKKSELLAWVESRKVQTISEIRSESQQFIRKRSFKK
jgi:excisionase family DNA binding protein